MAVEMRPVVRRQRIVLAENILFHTHQVGPLRRVITHYLSMGLPRCRGRVRPVGVCSSDHLQPRFAFATSANTAHQITSSSFRRNSSPCSTIMP